MSMTATHAVPTGGLVRIWMHGLKHLVTTDMTICIMCKRPVVYFKEVVIPYVVVDVLLWCTPTHSAITLFEIHES